MGERTDLAGYGPRVAATLLDGLIIFAAALVVAVIASAAGASSDTFSIVIIAALVLSSLLYAPALMCRAGARNGQTLGKQWMHVRVVRQDAEIIELPLALLREFVGKGLLGLIPFFTIVDYLFPLGDARRQSIHDKIASTFVVRADAVPDLPAGPSGGPAEVAAAPSAWAPPTGEAPTSWAPPVAAEPPPAPEPDEPPRGPFGPSSRDE